MKITTEELRELIGAGNGDELARALLQTAKAQKDAGWLRAEVERLKSSLEAVRVDRDKLDDLLRQYAHELCQRSGETLSETIAATRARASEATRLEAEVERLRADAALGRQVRAMPPGAELFHRASGDCWVAARAFFDIRQMASTPEAALTAAGITANEPATEKTAVRRECGEGNGSPE